MVKRHRTKTGDGGGSSRYLKKQEEKLHDLVFHDDPSEDSLSDNNDDSENDFSEEEMLPLSKGVMKEMESDDSNDEVEDMDKHWGSSRKGYYDNDFDDEAEEEEETAVLDLQKKQIEELDDSDFDYEEEEDEEALNNELKNVKCNMEGKDEVVLEDTSDLTLEEKTNRVKRRYPEVIGLMNELKNSVVVCMDVLTPMIEEIKQKNILEIAVPLRRLYMVYSMHISFYLSLKSKNVDVQHHPIVGKMLKLKQLVDDSKPLFKQVIQYHELNVDDMDVEEEITTKDTSEGSNYENLAADTFYQSIANGKQAKKSTRKAFYAPEETVAHDDTLENNDKRAATYQMIHNRGLTAHKNKINRNPRVKKRMQYKKAVIRRKGQVRDIREGETSHYGGEKTGIQSNLSRSRKFQN